MSAEEKSKSIRTIAGSIDDQPVSLQRKCAEHGIEDGRPLGPQRFVPATFEHDGQYVSICCSKAVIYRTDTSVSAATCDFGVVNT